MKKYNFYSRKKYCMLLTLLFSQSIDKKMEDKPNPNNSCNSVGLNNDQLLKSLGKSADSGCAQGHYPVNVASTDFHAVEESIQTCHNTGSNMISSQNIDRRIEDEATNVGKDIISETMENEANCNNCNSVCVNDDELLESLDETTNIGHAEGDYPVNTTPTDCYECSLVDTWSGSFDHNSTKLTNRQPALNLNETTDEHLVDLCRHFDSIASSSDTKVNDFVQTSSSSSNRHVNNSIKRPKKDRSKRKSKRTNKKSTIGMKNHLMRVKAVRENAIPVRRANAEMIAHLHEQDLHTSMEELKEVQNKLSNKDSRKYTYAQNFAMYNATSKVDEISKQLNNIKDYKKVCTEHRLPYRRKCADSNITSCIPKYNTRSHKKSVSSQTDKKSTNSLSSSSVESDDEEKDPTFNIDTFEAITKKKKSRNVNRRQLKLSSAYTTYHSKTLDVMHNKDDYVNIDAASSSGNDSECIEHKWVYDLKALDNQKEAFASKSLVIIRGNSTNLSSRSWTDLCRLKSLTLESIEKVVIVPRCICGQIYVCQGLQRSLHFSLGKTAILEMKKRLNVMGIMVKVYSKEEINRDFHGAITPKEYANFKSDGIYVRNMRQSKSDEFVMSDSIEDRLKICMSNMGKELWNTLFMVRCLFQFFQFHLVLVC